VLYHNLRNLILASGSPRRREMLASLGIEIQVVVSGVDEGLDGGDGYPGSLSCRWAGEKAEHVARAFPNDWVLAADTVVALGKRVFGKPVDDLEASAMLNELNGRTHRVFSGMALVNLAEGVRSRQVVCTCVRFRKLHPDEIAAYVRTGEPLDKAGGYGIQGLGTVLVHSIEGSYTNVVGLPLAETLEWLLENGIIKPR
jgi:septum formation protein